MTEPEASSEPSQRGAAARFQILSLDGGGFKGMFSAALLECLEQDLGRPIADHFDLVTGTSTGGIIALGLGAGRSSTEIVDFYVNDGPKIFGRRAMRNAKRVFASKYPGRPLRQALERVFGERTLADSRLRLAIPTYDLCNDDVYLFRTPHAPTLRRDGRELMTDVALATSAAPTYLPAHPLRGLRLVDGGMWANNPTIVGITEAVSVFGHQLDEIRVLSIGTTEETTYRKRRLNRGGFVGWALDAITVVLRGQSIAACNTAQHLLGKDNLLRINPQVPARELALDRVSPDQLRGRAEYWSRHSSRAVADRFLDHHPNPYIPV